MHPAGHGGWRGGPPCRVEAPPAHIRRRPQASTRPPICAHAEGKAAAGQATAISTLTTSTTEAAAAASGTIGIEASDYNVDLVGTTGAEGPGLPVGTTNKASASVRGHAESGRR